MAQVIYARIVEAGMAWDWQLAKGKPDPKCLAKHAGKHPG